MIIDKVRETDAVVELRGGFLTFAGKLMARAVNALIDRDGGMAFDFRELPSKTVAQLAEIAPAAPAVAYCANESGGATLVFWDGAAWRRAQDRAVIS